MSSDKHILLRFWKFLQQDTWTSFAVTLLLAFIIIKFVFFPGLSFITGTSLPLVIVESCSMHHHEYGFEKIFESPVYKEKNIGIGETLRWPFSRGFTKGDVIFVIGAKNINRGDIIIFNGGARHPLIHRVVEITKEKTGEIYYSTKGDNYKTNFAQLPSEIKISEDQLIGKALLRIPSIGWIKLIFFEGTRNSVDRGLCF